MPEDINKEETETTETTQQTEPQQAEAPAQEPETAQSEETAQDAEPAQNDELTALQAELEKAQAQRDEYLAMAQRAQADYQNFKRRNSATRTEAYDDGVRESIAAILPTVDNLERAIAAAEGNDGALASGVQMTLRQLMETLTKLGLEEVPALGEKFDPDIHNAVMRVPAEDGNQGTVLEVFQKGYRVKGRMIRYAMVKIAAED